MSVTIIVCKPQKFLDWAAEMTDCLQTLCLSVRSGTDYDAIQQQCLQQTEPCSGFVITEEYVTLCMCALLQRIAPLALTFSTSLLLQYIQLEKSF